MPSGPHLAPAAPIGLDRVIELARLASTLVASSGARLLSAIEDYAMKVGQLLEADSLIVSSWSPGQREYRLRVEWFRPGFHCVPAQRTGDHLFGQFPWFASEVARQGYFTVTDASKLPSEARAERRHLEWIGRRAMMSTVDMLPDGSGVAIALSQHVRPRAWSPADIDDMTTALGVLAAALRRFDREASPRVDYSLLFRNESRALAVLDSGVQTLLSVNEQFAHMHGFRADELSGEAVRTVSPERNSPHAMAAISRLREQGHYVFDVVHRRADGSLFPCRVEATRVDAEDGTTCFLVVLEDRSVEASYDRVVAVGEGGELAHNVELQGLGLLAGGIAHDFNNLLVGILGNAELARMSTQDGTPGAKALDDLRAAATRASGLANQMLAYAGKRQLDPEPLDLRAELEELADVLGGSLYKGAELRVECEDDLRAVADATHTRQILMNLLVNASDAMAANDLSGQIVLRAGRVQGVALETLAASFISDPSSEFVYLEVEDAGCGMSESVRSRIFDPFFTTKVSGRGLGMATVLECVRQHGGGIRVRSTLGAGTSIRVYLPDHGATETMTETKPRPLRLAEPRQGKVLIAEDEDVVRTLLRRLLERRGLTVLEASDGVEAQRQFAEHDDISLAMVDVSMPRMDGITLLDSLGPENETPIVLMSGYSSEDISLRRSEQRVVVFLQKPFEAWELDEIIDRFLE